MKRQMIDRSTTDPVMERVRLLFKVSGMTLEQLGSRAGYANGKSSVRKFLNSRNPTIAQLRRFSQALNVQVAGLLRE